MYRRQSIFMQWWLYPLLGLFVIAIVLIIKLLGGNTADKQSIQTETVQQTQNAQVQAVETEAPTQEQVIQVDESLFDVTITLPSTFFEETTPEDIETAAQEQGIKKVTINDDGSVTYVMSKKQHNQLMDDLQVTILEYFDEIKGEEYPSIKDIEYKNDFSEITLVVDRQAYESSFDAFAVLGVAFQCLYYQKFDGKEMHVVINSKDNQTGEVFGTTIYPDALEE